GDHEAGEELAEGGDVAVQALDQLAGTAGGVERQVEAEAVAKEIGAQEIGRPPADLLAKVGGAHRRQLRDESDGDEEQRRQEQRGSASAGHRAVDELAQDLGVEELKTNPAQKQAGKERT